MKRTGQIKSLLKKIYKKTEHKKKIDSLKSLCSGQVQIFETHSTLEFPRPITLLLVLKSKKKTPEFPRPITLLLVLKHYYKKNSELKFTIAKRCEAN